MAAVKSQDTRLEQDFLDDLKPEVVREIELHPNDVLGKPDFVSSVRAG